MSRARPRRRSSYGAWALHYGPNMTPMVDVVMVILVFFMASAAVLGPEWFLRSSLPVVRTGPPAHAPDKPKRETRFEFALARVGNSTRVRGEGLDGAPLSALRPRLTQLVSDHATDTLAVLVRPEPDVPYQDLVTVHDLCQRLGVDKVGMMDSESLPPPAPAPDDAPK